jgi:hypothetical protein
VLRFLLFRAWVFPDRGDTDQVSTVVAAHNPSSPTYATTVPYRPGGTPLPQRPPQHTPYQTTQFRAGEAADGNWRDATMRLQPVRPHDTHPGDAR